MQRVIDFLNSFPPGTRSEWARQHGMDPVRISQIVGGHKGIGLDYAIKLIKASDGRLSIDDFDGVSTERPQ